MGREIVVLEQYREDIERINKSLETVIDHLKHGSREVGSYATFSNGKRIRPLLFLLFCKAFNHCSDEIYLQSSVYELIHTASLIHDDVLDNAELRRNRPTVNSIWGNHMAVLCGDNLYITALQIAMSTMNLEYVSMLIETVKQMTDGQILELENTMNFDIDKTTYFRIIRQKTASLIGAACRGAGIICGLPEELRESLYQSGISMGTAFQMVDDLLDITGREEELGKEIGKDLLEGKVTIPIIYLFQGLDGKDLVRYKEALRNGMARQVIPEISKRITDEGIGQRVLSEADSYCKDALRVIELLPQSDEKQGLLELNRFIIGRSF